MPDKILLVFIGFNILYLFCAGLHLFIPLWTKARVTRAEDVNTIATNLLLDNCPLTAAEVDAILMFLVFLLGIPSYINKRNRTFLKAHAAGVILTALITLGIGIEIWYSTLQTKKNLLPLWNAQSSANQSLLQSKFQCCGYNNPALSVKDATCPTAAAAAALGSCVSPFSVFANRFLDVVFTTFFGFVAVDMLLLLAGLCMLKDRKEKERYRLIDEKVGFGPI